MNTERTSAGYSRKKNGGPFFEAEGNVGRKNHPLLYSLVAIYLILSVVGLINLYSASLGGDHFYGQLRHTFVGLVVFVVFGWIVPVRILNDYAYHIYAVTIIALLLVLAFGYSSGGSQRWIRIASMTIQPSELAKVTVAIVVARYFHYNTQSDDYKLMDLWPAAALVFGIFFLIFQQPDLGTAGVCLLIGAVQVSMLRLNTRSVLFVGAGGLIAAIMGWFILLRDYQKMRILTLLNPELDPTGNGYNSLQSLVAVGSGQLTGKGFMKGTQTQLQFLPARHTDFVFSVFAEEHGFWVGWSVFITFGILTYIALQIGKLGKDTFSNLLAIGLAGYIFVEFLINISMVLGMFPVVGMPLPFFSQGGSALVSVSLAVGLLVGLYRNRKSARA
jgi:rod shape determining protein RodA